MAVRRDRKKQRCAFGSPMRANEETLIREDSTLVVQQEGGDGRSAISPSTQLAQSRSCAGLGRRVVCLKQRRKPIRRGGIGVDLGIGQTASLGIERAMGASGEARPVGCNLNLLRHYGIRTGTMVRSVAAAARRQPHIAVGLEHGCKRPHRKKKNKKAGQTPPHLSFNRTRKRALRPF